jgi:WbqC-like protein
MKASIHQPNFLPYLGLFNKIKHSDLFVIYDVAQYVRDRFDNRNLIKTEQGTSWLTVPLQVKESFQRRFYQVPMPASNHWKAKHLKMIRQNYRKAAYFERYFPDIERIYLEEHTHLTGISTMLIEYLMKQFRIDTPLVKTTDLGLDLSLKSSDTLIDILKRVGAGDYLAGASGRKYMDMDLMQRTGIRVEFQQFVHPSYRQLHGSFVQNLAAIDLLFNEGENSYNYV